MVDSFSGLPGVHFRRTGKVQAAVQSSNLSPGALLTDNGLSLLVFPAPPQTLRVFGHFSLRSEWQLVKVDYKSIFSRRCTKEDYQTWHLLNQVQPRVGHAGL